jgi:hypothetical protein
LEAKDLKSAPIFEVKDAAETIFMKNGHHHPEGFLSSLEIDKYCTSQEIHSLNVPGFLTLLSEGIQHIKQLFLASLGSLEKGNIREGPVHIFLYICSSYFLSLQNFKSPIKVWFLLLTIEKFSPKIPKLNSLYS